jgi:hypothetical protein
MAVLKYYNTATSAWEYIAASTTANFTSWKKTMAGGETSVSGTDDNAVTLSYTVGLEQVFINGVLQVRGTDYVATTGTSVTGLTALVASDIVTVVCYAPFNVANTIAPTVVDAKGDLIVGTAADTVGRLAVGTNNQLLSAASGESSGLKWVSGGLTLINTTTFSAVASQAIDSVFSATYPHYFVIVTMTTTSSPTFTMVMRTGAVDNTNSNYNFQRLEASNTGVTATRTTSGASWAIDTQTDTPKSFIMKILNPFSSSDNTFMENFANTAGYLQLGGARFSANTSFDGFKIICSTGNMTGTAKIYGLAN